MAASRTFETGDSIALVVRQSLEEGKSVEIDGLGVFRRGADGRFQFIPRTAPRVFLAYVEEDLVAVWRIFKELAAAGCDPWLDKVKLLPGQNWPRAIDRAISLSDCVVACFSRHAVSKRGFFHSELRYALDCASMLPLDETFLIPVRLEECEVPLRITNNLQYVDLFPDFEKGMRRVIAAIRRRKP